MISDRTASDLLGYSEAYVWVWLPQATKPVVAGVLTAQDSRQDARLVFNYGRSYLARPDAIALYAPELPLRAGLLPLLPGLLMPSCIRDASPDAWGRRVLMNRMRSRETDLSELAYLLESGSDRVGALDFQTSATHYVPRQRAQASLADLMQAADKVEQGLPLPPELGDALLHGTSLGGARPKALMDDAALPAGSKYIAKFSTSRDLYSVVKAEFVAMRLAHKVGIHVAAVELREAMGKDVLLIERFDRSPVKEQAETAWQRKAMVSALTMLELDEMMAAYASYEKLADIIRHRFAAPKATLRELFNRLVFNILCGNTDDHARNHAAFWDGSQLSLTPAYDICPQVRTGQEASQAMLIQGKVRSSQIAACVAAAAVFLLSRSEAVAMVNHQTEQITRHWQTVCDEARLSQADRALLWRRQFLNPFAFYEAPQEVSLP